MSDLGSRHLQLRPAAILQTLLRAADLRARDALDPEDPDQVVDQAGRDPFDVRLGDDGDKRPLRPTALLQKPRREVRALVELGDPQIDRAGAGVPAPLAVPVALVVRSALRSPHAAPATAEASANMSVSANVRAIAQSRSGSPSSIVLRRNASGSIVGLATVSSSLAIRDRSAEDGTVVLYVCRLTPSADTPLPLTWPGDRDVVRPEKQNDLDAHASKSFGSRP